MSAVEGFRRISSAGKFLLSVSGLLLIFVMVMLLLAPGGMAQSGFLIAFTLPPAVVGLALLLVAWIGEGFTKKPVSSSR